jgi:hypothetical protein
MRKLSSVEPVRQADAPIKQRIREYLVSIGESGDRPRRTLWMKRSLRRRDGNYKRQFNSKITCCTGMIIRYHISILFHNVYACDIEQQR